MNQTNNVQSKYQSRSNYILLWFVIWYLIGFLYAFISGLPSVTTWNIQESLTREGSSTIIESGSIVHILVFSATWPIIYGAFFTVGWIIGGEFVGTGASSNSPLIILLYYIKLVQYSLPIFVIGFISGLIALIPVKIRTTRTSLY
ncbi:MAG: hypothetical protein ACFE95_00100 [Candidatus Hodarchaeota archaeon]